MKSHIFKVTRKINSQIFQPSVSFYCYLVESLPITYENIFFIPPSNKERKTGSQKILRKIFHISYFILS